MSSIDSSNSASKAKSRSASRSASTELAPRPKTVIVNSGDSFPTLGARGARTYSFLLESSVHFRLESCT
jgi:hypothetical protein